MTYYLGVALLGLIVGALGRLLVPGRNDIGILATAAVGIAGSFLGGLVGSLIFAGSIGGLFLAVVAAALIVWIIESSRSGRRR